MSMDFQTIVRTIFTIAAMIGRGGENRTRLSLGQSQVSLPNDNTPIVGPSGKNRTCVSALSAQHSAIELQRDFLLFTRTL